MKYRLEALENSRRRTEEFAAANDQEAFEIVAEKFAIMSYGMIDSRNFTQFGYKALYRLDGGKAVMIFPVVNKGILRAVGTNKKVRLIEHHLCQTCYAQLGKTRIDNGSAAGTHCDECWRKMVRECRRRSW